MAVADPVAEFSVDWQSFAGGTITITTAGTVPCPERTLLRVGKFNTGMFDVDVAKKFTADLGGGSTSLDPWCMPLHETSRVLALSVMG